MKYTREILEDAVRHNTGIIGVMKYLAIGRSGGMHNYLSRKIKDMGIDTSHFLGLKHNVGKAPTNKYTKEDFIRERLRKLDKYPNTTTIRLFLLKFGIKNHQCEHCYNTEWMGEEIPLELHHDNGDRMDNRLENIKLLCPNCHAKTNTFRGKKNRNRDVTPLSYTQPKA